MTNPNTVEDEDAVERLTAQRDYVLEPLWELQEKAKSWTRGGSAARLALSTVAVRLDALLAAPLVASGRTSANETESFVVETDATRDAHGNNPLPRLIGPFPTREAAESYMYGIGPLWGSWNVAPLAAPAES